jgi:thiopeptide-type bacteriocin biosynthesis protein
MKRKFLLGSEWLYIKIYGGPKILEDVLINEIYELNKTLSLDFVDKFFFIRYYDDDGNHLRIRYHIKNTRKTLGEILFKINNRLSLYIEKNLLAKVTFETYNREVERYGSINIEDIETLFSCESSLILLIIKKIDNNDVGFLEEKRWLYCIYLIDFILSKFLFSIDDKTRVLEQYYEFYKKEFNLSKTDCKLLNDRYRVKSDEMKGMVNSEVIIMTLLNDLQIDTYTNAFSNILKRKKEKKLDVDFDSLVMDIIHMTCNRFFRIKQRNHELVLYHFMTKYYTSHKAKISYAKKQIKQ